MRVTDVFIDDSSVESYLKNLVTFYGDHPSAAGFVLQHGRAFIPAKRPKGVRKQKYKACYSNSGNYAMMSEGYCYVEGYARSDFGLICEHAWLVDAAGVVLDLTWKNPEKCEYFGVPFKQEYMCATALRTKVWGLIGFTNIPLFTTAPEEFLQESGFFTE